MVDSEISFSGHHGAVKSIELWSSRLAQKPLVAAVAIASV